MKSFFLLIAGFLLLAGGVAPAQSGPLSLAEIAKQNRAKQNGEKKKPVLVLDDEDLPASRGVKAADQNTSAPAAAVSNSKASDGATSSGAKAGKESEAGTGDSKDVRVTELKKKLDTYTAKRDSWKDVAKGDEDRLANETDDFRRQMYEDALQGDRNNVTLYQKKIDQTQSELNQAQQAPANQAARQGETAPAESK